MLFMNGYLNIKKTVNLSFFYIFKIKNMTTHEYTNGEITISWKPEVCEHAGICVKMLPKVYNPKERPWMKPENATTVELVEQVSKCPSGALSIK